MSGTRHSRSCPRVAIISCLNFHGIKQEILSFPARLVKRRSGFSKHRSALLSTTHQQLGKQLNGIRRRRRKGEGKKNETQKSGGISETAVGGVVDSCQMLIKAKERKTLVSPVGGCRKSRNGRSRRPTSRSVRHHHRHTSRRACARIFILREL